MGKYLESFRKNLKDALDSNLISKAELHRRTGISLSMLYRYLEDSEPGLHTLELLAEALGTTPLELIKLEDEPLIRAHTLQDCFNEVTKAADMAKTQVPEKSRFEILDKYLEGHNPKASKSRTTAKRDKGK